MAVTEALSDDEFADRWTRFWGRVDPEVDSTCWVWTGKPNKDGYGQITIGKVKYMAHRLTDVLLVGPIPEGMEIDHTCRRRLCVNPRHLEAVTHAENMRRAAAAHTHCSRGHAYAEHAFINSAGWRECRLCAHTSKLRSQRQRRGDGPGRANWTHCSKGHELGGENLIVRPNGNRACRACKNAAQRRRRAVASAGH